EVAPVGHLVGKLHCPRPPRRRTTTSPAAAARGTTHLGKPTCRRGPVQRLVRPLHRCADRSSQGAGPGRTPYPDPGGRSRTSTRHWWPGLSAPPLVRLRRGASRPSYWWNALPRTPFGRVPVLHHDAPPPASPRSVPATRIVEVPMSRRKHKPHNATPPIPTPRAAPDNRAAQPAETDVVYHDSLPIRHRHAGAVDLGLPSHWAAAPPLSDGTPQVAEFDTYTDGLEALADWLRQHGVTTVALEATGVYWEPLFAILQDRGFDVILVAPTYTSGIKGRPKTDRLDCQWIQRLHAHGLLPASFRPSAEVVVLRHYLRQRAELVRNAARHIQHMQKALEQMNLKLPEVLSDITGLSGRK